MVMGFLAREELYSCFFLLRCHWTISIFECTICSSVLRNATVTASRLPLMIADVNSHFPINIDQGIYSCSSSSYTLTIGDIAACSPFSTNEHDNGIFPSPSPFPCRPVNPSLPCLVVHVFFWRVKTAQCYFSLVSLCCVCYISVHCKISGFYYTFSKL